MDDFHKTRMGQKFYEHDMPALIRALTRVGDLMEKAISSEAACPSAKELELRSTLELVHDHIHENELAGQFPHALMVAVDKAISDSPEERLKLAQEVYEAAVEETEGFEDSDEHIGADLAYLMGAIIKDGGVDRWSRNTPFMSILERRFPKEHAVWCYIVDRRGEE